MATGTILRKFAGLTFDAVFEEAHESNLQVTDNPVESGVVISDHAFMLPLSLTIQAGVTDSPMVERIGDPFSSGARSVRAFELLSALQKSAEPFDVQTGLKLYKHMVCVSLKTMQDKETANALVFTADLREVIIVYTRKVKYKSQKVKTDPNSPKDQTAEGGISGKSKTVNEHQATPKPGATSRQASAVADRGEVKGNEVTSPQRKSSVLKKLKDYIAS